MEWGLHQNRHKILVSASETLSVKKFTPTHFYQIKINLT